MDFLILDLIQSLRTPFLDEIMPMITKLGDKGIIWIALAIVLLTFKRTRPLGICVVIALLLELAVCNIVIKPLVARTRPFDINTGIQLLVSKPTDYSFPSGHTGASFAVVAALGFSREKKLFVITLVPAILIAVSRLYLYVHFPTDVLAGALLGVGSGYAAYRICKWRDERNKNNDSRDKEE